MSSQSGNKDKKQKSDENPTEYTGEYSWLAQAFHTGSSFGNFEQPAPPFYNSDNNSDDISEIIILPLETNLLRMPFLATLQNRTSSRDFRTEALNLTDVSALLWAAYGCTNSQDDYERRTVPSAGALFPLSLVIVAMNIKNLSRGCYEYLPTQNGLKKIEQLNLPDRISSWFRTKHVNYDNAAAIIFFIGQVDRVCSKYGERGYRYLLLEAGHIAQNLSLAATALGLNHIPIGGFDDNTVNDFFPLTDWETIIYSFIIG